MHKKLLLLLLSFNLIASEDTISKFAHDYFKNIHGHISDESFDKAQNLLDIAVNRYWQNENSYESTAVKQTERQELHDYNQRLEKKWISLTEVIQTASWLPNVCVR